MPNAGLGQVVRRLRELALLDGAGLSDGELLERYVCHREEAAFTALVRIHGPMVLGVCRRLLRDTHDADDAFQATFLVLVRKAHAIVPRERVGAWLYGVAYRTSLRAKAMANRRRAKQKALEDVPSPPANPEAEWLALLDHEIMRLPEKYRVPLVLCDLERKTRKQAARQIGCPEGTLATRLRHARALVQKRLTRHGLAPSACAITVTWTHAVSAAVPSSLLAATVSNASLFTAGKIAGLIPLPIIALAEGVLKAMVLTKVKTIGALLILVSALGLGVGGMAGGSRFAATAQTPVAKAKAVSPVRPTIIEENNGLLPLGPAPIQALVSLDKDKVVVRTILSVRHLKEGVNDLGHKVQYYESSNKLGTRRYNLGDIEVYDMHLRRLKTTDLAKLLNVEQDPDDVEATNRTPRPITGTPTLLLYGSGDIDPLHLRLFKEKTLLLVLPQSVPLPSQVTEPPPPGVIPLPNPPAAIAPFEAPPPPPPETPPSNGTPQTPSDQAEGDLDAMKFYFRTGHGASAIFYANLIQRRYPNSPYAHEANQLIDLPEPIPQPPPPVPAARRVGRIIIVGNKKTPDAFIRETLGLYPGDTLKLKDARNAEEKLPPFKALIQGIEILATFRFLEPYQIGYKDILVEVTESLPGEGRTKPNTKVALIVKPGKIDFGLIRHGDRPEKFVDLEVTGSSPWSLTNIAKNKAAPFVLKVEEISSGGKKGYRIYAKINPDAPLGAFREHVVLNHNDSANCVFSFIVEGNISNTDPDAE